MPDLQPYNPHELSRDARRAARINSRHQSDGQIRATSIDVETDVALVKIDALTAATGTAMGAVLKVANAQKTLEQLCPEVSGKLELLSQNHLLTVADVTTDLGRHLRRR